ncbi:MAG: hypothetical protein EPO53_24840 [Variovorax sp.]|nr:MAG: hypothetical protein EPO53_24840 [Variovorax sp.]
MPPSPPRPRAGPRRRCRPPTPPRPRAGSSRRCRTSRRRRPSIARGRSGPARPRAAAGARGTGPPWAPSARPARCPRPSRRA